VRYCKNQLIRYLFSVLVGGIFPMAKCSRDIFHSQLFNKKKSLSQPSLVAPGVERLPTKEEF
jgi:hypothetical protein